MNTLFKDLELKHKNSKLTDKTDVNCVFGTMKDPGSSPD